MRLVVLPEQRFAVMAFLGSRSQQIVSTSLEQTHIALNVLGLNPKR